MAVFKEYSVTVDLFNGVTQDGRIVFDQNDYNSGRLNVTITSKSVPVNLTGSTVTIAFLKKDETSVFQQCEITDAVGGKVRVVLNSQTLAVPGLVKVDLTINNGGATTTTSGFYINVKDSIMNDKTVQSANEFSIIQKAIDAGEVLGDVDLQAIVDNTTNVNGLMTDVEGLSTNVTALNQEMSQSARATKTLKMGTQVVDTPQASPLDLQVEGRTQVSLATSNLETDKMYVIADKKSKVKVDSVTTAGIGKLKKKSTVTSKADFVGKVSGSTVENPHTMKYNTASTLVGPGAFTGGDTNQTGYNQISNLDNSIANFTIISNGAMSKMLFSFNMIEQVERNMGRIPKESTADKIQWLKDNINNLTLTWYGYGSSPSGNKATLLRWRHDTQSWFTSGSSVHTSGSVAPLVAGMSPASAVTPAMAIDDTGVIHYMTHAEASDGVVTSAILTDYIKLDVELKSTAQLDTRPVLLRVANFEGKVSGSTVENPHKHTHATHLNTLGVPSQINYEPDTTNYNHISAMGGGVKVITSTTNGIIPQVLFSFDLIAEVERSLGKIPANDVTGKIAWLRANVARVTGRWYGYGTSPTGNKASLKRWIPRDASWFGSSTHSSGIVEKLDTGTTSFGSEHIGGDGWVHFLSYSEPSNGITTSTLYTDYLELEIELFPPKDWRFDKQGISDFTSKVTGSLVENPNFIKPGTSATLQPPTTGFSETSSYENIKKVDNVYIQVSSSTNGQIAQSLFYFDIVKHVERYMGIIPKDTTTDKVQWLKDNLSQLKCNWYGYGSGAAGNKATLVMWNYSVNSWDETAVKVEHTNPTTTKLVFTSTNTSIRFNSNGLVHALIFAPSSDGTIPSVINTDYINLEVELKNTAALIPLPNALQAPRVPLYEVSQADYDKIGVTYTDQDIYDRFPIVEGNQSVSGLMVTQEGENLLPPFYEWTLHANSKALSPYELQLDATASGQVSSVNLPTIIGQSYTLSVNLSSNIAYVDIKDKNSTYMTRTDVGASGPTNKIFTATTDRTIIEFKNNAAGTLTFKESMLTLGSTVKPFVPRNPNYLIADLKLRSVGDKKDILFHESGEWKRNKVVEELVLDGTLSWASNANYTGSKSVKLPIIGSGSINGTLVKHDNKILKSTLLSMSDVGGDVYRQSASDINFFITIANSDTGFGESYVPLGDEIKAYFNGWKAKTVDGAGKPTAWMSVVDGTDAPTQTLTYVAANKAPNYTPYKLYYVRSAALNEVVTNQVEGALTVNGPTQLTVETGAVVREKVIPYGSVGTDRQINRSDTVSQLKNKLSKFISVYKNGIVDTSKWYINPSLGYGSYRATIPDTSFDPTAEYTVTYVVLDRDKFSTLPITINGIHNQSVRSTVNQVTAKIADQETAISVNIRAIAELYKRVKALGG